MSQPTEAIVQQSYSRCQRTDGFFERFYSVLLDRNPSLEPMFAETQFPRQHKLLQHGIGLLLSYARKRDDQLLERIAARHSKAGLDVDPALYPAFVDALIEAVSESDPRFDDEIEQAWRAAVQPGIDFMKSRYGS